MSTEGKCQKKNKSKVDLLILIGNHICVHKVVSGV